MTVVAARKGGLKGKHQRLVLILLGVVAMIGAVLLAMSALKDQAAYFYTPVQALAAKVPAGQAIRLGGMVVAGSIQREPDGVTTRFVLTDGEAQVPATYSGITPDLFKEGSGAVAEGAFDANGTFRATEVLAKHDERYMPREMEGIEYNSETHEVEQDGAPVAQ